MGRLTVLNVGKSSAGGMDNGKQSFREWHAAGGCAAGQRESGLIHADYDSGRNLALRFHLLPFNTTVKLSNNI